jgi:hypothetical protein
MSISEVDICNMALAKVGHSRINDLTDQNTAARQCNEAYPIIRDQLLEDHPWNFAEKRYTCPLLDVTPPFEYSYYYGLPADVARVLYLYNTADAFRVEEGARLATNTAPCNILYTALVTDTNQFSPLFIEALYYKLAAHLAPVLSDNKALADSLEGKADRAIAKAKTRDAQVGSAIKTKFKNDWIGRRRPWGSFVR